MAFRALIMVLSLVAGIVSLSGSTVLASPHIDPCVSKTAPKGWLRPGGYCEIAADLHQYPTPGGGSVCAGDNAQDLMTRAGQRLHLVTHCDGSYDGTYENGRTFHHPRH